VIPIYRFSGLGSFKFKKKGLIHVFQLSDTKICLIFQLSDTLNQVKHSEEQYKRERQRNTG